MLLLFNIIPSIIFFLFVLFFETRFLIAEPYMCYINIITAATNNDALHLLLTYGALDTMLGALCVISLNTYSCPWK